MRGNRWRENIRIDQLIRQRHTAGLLNPQRILIAQALITALRAGGDRFHPQHRQTFGLQTVHQRQGKLGLAATGIGASDKQAFATTHGCSSR